MPCSFTLVLIFRMKSMRGKADLTASPPSLHVCVYAYILCSCVYRVCVDVWMCMFCAVYISCVCMCVCMFCAGVYIVCLCVCVHARACVCMRATLERSENNLRYCSLGTVYIIF